MHCAPAGRTSACGSAWKRLALVEQAAYPITYLSGRTVKSFAQPVKASAEDYLLVQPSDYSIWPASWDSIINPALK